MTHTPDFCIALLMQLAAHLQIHSCLRHSQWDTRVAASTCLGLMAAHFTHHSVSTLAAAAEPATTASVKEEELGEASAMSFQNFNISQVLKQGTVLVASGGQVCPLLYTTYTCDERNKAMSCLAVSESCCSYFNCLTALAMMLPFRNMKCYLRKAQGQNSLQNSRKPSRCGRCISKPELYCFSPPMQTYFSQERFSQEFQLFQEEHKEITHAGWD